MQTITIRVDTEKNENFECCDNCVHCDDGEDICRLRCCVHAFCTLKECYNPKRGKQKMGHWIRMKAYEKWGCSECHTVFRLTFKEHNFCPNCGAKMVELHESEAPFKVGDIVKLKESDPVRDGCDCGLVTWVSKDMIYVMRKDGSCGDESPDDFEVIHHSDNGENVLNMLRRIIKEEVTKDYEP